VESFSAVSLSLSHVRFFYGHLTFLVRGSHAAGPKLWKFYETKKRNNTEFIAQLREGVGQRAIYEDGQLSHEIFKFECYEYISILLSSLVIE
jgi:hypothetical protein